MLAALARSSQAAFCSVRPAVGAIRALVGKRTAATQAPYFANTKIPSRPRLLDSSWNPVNQAIQESTKTPDEIWAQREPTVATLGRPNGPFFGRSVQVNSQSIHLNQALARLRSIIRNNNVPREAKLQTRHEKKGYKRRRIESERWRRRFAHEVRMKVQIVKEIRARGA